jgi:[protein-PII] uridylyltransferase
VDLSAFLHDIGKGRGGDHSATGAELASVFLTRAGFERGVVESVASAVRDHLLLARTASRRDIASPEVIDDVARAMGGLRALQVLYLLTVADSKATGRTMWSEWKETLLRQLYTRVAARFGEGEQEDVVRADHVAALTGGRLTSRVVGQHLSALPDEYAETMETADVVWHLEAISGLAGDSKLAVHQSGSRVLVVGHDRRGFLLSICRAFAAHGIGVHDARLYTRADGVVIDVFEVRDDPGGGPVPPDRWARVEETLAVAETNGRDLLRAVGERAAAYDSGQRSGVAIRPRPELSTRHTVLEVRAVDRVGLLVDIVEALYAEGLDLHLALIDTRANQAIDVLHVGRSGAPIDDPSVLSDMCRRMEARISG